MGKIDYSKAEKEISEALRKWRAKELAEGKSITSKRAAEYFGLEEENARPPPQDPVVQLISEEAAKLEQAQKESMQRPEGEEETEDEPSFEIAEQTPAEDVMWTYKEQSERTPKRKRPEKIDVPPSEKFLEPLSPLAILRKHILWLKRLHMDNRFELLGTTKEEIRSFIKSQRLTNEQINRIQELIARAKKMKEQLLKKYGAQSDEELIEQQKKRRIKFKIKESWLPL